jgi:serine/threonine protein kinase
MCFDTADAALPRTRTRSRKLPYYYDDSLEGNPPVPQDDPMSPSQPGTPDVPVAEFVRDLTRSQVLPDARAGKLFAEAPPAKKWNPADFAGHLVALGELTQYQADKLLLGHWRGLALGPYRILCPLGRGGMGMVYLARPAGDTHAVVALKVLPPQRAAAEPRMLARFRREMDIGLTLPPHPHLTRTLEAGEVHGVHYLAMEYVPGRTVKQVVTTDGPLPVGAAARVFADVAAGLGAAHAAGFIHRDLKPSNVIVTPAGRAKLLDFGFALIRGEAAPADPTVIGGPGYALGTMDYLAPEQAENPAAVGPAADLYALGCSLYFAVTGSPPFPNGTPQDKIRWQRTATPAPVTQLNPRVPDDFARLIDDLMAKSPEARPASAEAVLKRLNAWADPIRAEAIPGDVSGRTDEMLRLAEATWQASETTPDESLVILDDPPPTPPALHLRVPYWLVAVAGVGCLTLLGLAVAVGWLLARVVR